MGFIAYLTFGFFLMGLLAGRSGLFKNYQERSSIIKKSWVIGTIMFAVSLVGLVAVFANLGPDVAFDNWLAMIGLTFYDLMNIGMTVIIIAVFIMLYKNSKSKKFLERFIPYGRMALTNYVAQSVIGTAIFYGWGLGYLTNIRSSLVLLLAILLVAVQVWLSNWWLNRFYYGPLEWMPRSYLMLVIDSLTFSASPIALPPSAPKLLCFRLQKGGHNGWIEG